MTLAAATPSHPRRAPTPPRAAWSPPRWVAAVAAALLLGVLVKEPELLLPIGPDQGTYSYVAERILEGGLPYVDAWDNKPPATYYVHAAVLGLVPPAARWTGACVPGTAQSCGYVALQAADVLWTATTALAVFAVARALGLSAFGSLSSIVLFSVFANLSQLSKEGATPEKQLLLPMVLAYLAALRGTTRWLVAAGLFAGIALLFKQTAISVPLALIVWMLFGAPLSRTVRAGVALAIGMTVPILAALGLFAVRGALPDLWAATVVYNLAQAGMSPLRIPYAFLAGSWHIFANSAALLWLLALGGALRVRAARQPLLLCWAAADVLSLFLGGSKFAQVYYVQLVPSLALLGGVAVEWGWSVTRGARALRAYVGVVAAGVFVLSNQFQMSVVLRAWNERTPGRASVSNEQQVAMGFLPGERGGPDRPLFIWGDNSEMYLWAAGRAPGRFFHVFPLSRQYASRGFEDRRAELMRSFAAHPPAIIAVDPATARDDPDGSLGLNIQSFPELQNFLRSRYQPIENTSAGWQAFSLRQAAASMAADSS